MKLHKDTIRIQNLLGDYCRSGKETAIPGVTPGRVHHYRRLVYNVIRDTMDRAFPIAMAALGEELWDQLVGDFFTNGLPHTPQVWKLPLEFYHYHAARETGVRTGKAFLDDLLYFEWIEIEVHTMPDRAFPDFVTPGNIFTDRLAINPEYEMIRLQYPVHLYPANETAGKQGNYFVLAFRVPETGHVQFLNLSPLNAYILTRLVEEEVPLNDLKGDIAKASGIESGKYLDDTLEQFVGDLIKLKLILGFLKE